MHTHTHTRLIFIYDDVYLAFIAIKEMKIKITMKYTFFLITLSNIKKNNTKSW